MQLFHSVLNTTQTLVRNRIPNIIRQATSYLTHLRRDRTSVMEALRECKMKEPYSIPYMSDSDQRTATNSKARHSLLFFVATTMLACLIIITQSRIGRHYLQENTQMNTVMSTELLIVFLWAFFARRLQWWNLLVPFHLLLLYATIVLFSMSTR